VAGSSSSSSSSSSCGGSSSSSSKEGKTHIYVGPQQPANEKPDEGIRNKTLSRDGARERCRREGVKVREGETRTTTP
jgi:hypothetical protein